VYSQSFHAITPPLCDHTGPTEGEADVTPSHPGLIIARHFAYRTHRITFTLSLVEGIYNIEVPRVQFVHGARVSEEAKLISGSSTLSSQCATSVEPEPKDVRRTLKREMRTWWHTLSERIDNLVGFFPPVYLGRDRRNSLNPGTIIPRRYRTISAFEIPPTDTLIYRPR
jgi:1-phosphatidylinositol-3-phosphate 5-kinase